MKEHIISLVVLIAMTVDTLPLAPVNGGNLVIENLCFFECGEVALGNLHEAR